MPRLLVVPPAGLLPFCVLVFAARAIVAHAADDAAMEIRVSPAVVRLIGQGAEFSLLVDGRDAAGRPCDITRVAHYRSLTPKVIDVSPAGIVRARADGTGVI